MKILWGSWSQGPRANRKVPTARGALKEAVPDPRARKGRWSLAQILRATLVGLLAGCRSLAEAEELTENLSPAARRLVGLPRRLPDTTARDALGHVPLDGLRAVLHRAVHAAWRRKALGPETLPIQVVGKWGHCTFLDRLPSFK